MTSEPATPQPTLPPAAVAVPMPSPAGAVRKGPRVLIEDVTALRRVATLILFALMIMFWVVFLAGIAATEDSCVPGAGVQSCGNQLSLAWYILFFELFCIACIILSSLVARLSARFTQTLLLLVTYETAVLTVVAANFVVPAFDTKGDSGPRSQGLRTASAGSVVLVILNLVWIVCQSDSEGMLAPRLVAAHEPKAAAPQATEAATTSYLALADGPRSPDPVKASNV